MHPVLETFNFIRLLKAVGYSLQGLKAVIRSEPAFRLELLLTAILIPLALHLTDDSVERALLISSVLLVLIVEILNSALEAVVDRISEKRHPLSKKAKDAGSAAVLLSALLALTVWLLILFS